MVLGVGTSVPDLPWSCSQQAFLSVTTPEKCSDSTLPLPIHSPDARANMAAAQRRRRERERAQREAGAASRLLPSSAAAQAQAQAMLNEGLARERAVIELSRLRRELAAWLPVRWLGVACLGRGVTAMQLGDGREAGEAGSWCTGRRHNAAATTTM